MVSAMWVVQRDCRDAAASLPPRCGADGSRLCSCSRSFCLSQELAEERVVEPVSSSSRTDQQACFGEALKILIVELLDERRRVELVLIVCRDCLQKRQLFFRELGQIGGELDLFETPEDGGPDRSRASEGARSIMRPKLSADEGKKVRMAERLAKKPFRKVL